MSKKPSQDEHGEVLRSYATREELDAGMRAIESDNNTIGLPFDGAELTAAEPRIEVILANMVASLESLVQQAATKFYDGENLESIMTRVHTISGMIFGVRSRDSKDGLIVVPLHEALDQFSESSDTAQSVMQEVVGSILGRNVLSKANVEAAMRYVVRSVRAPGALADGDMFNAGVAYIWGGDPRGIHEWLKKMAEEAEQGEAGGDHNVLDMMARFKEQVLQAPQVVMIWAFDGKYEERVAFQLVKDGDGVRLTKTDLDPIEVLDFSWANQRTMRA